MQPACLKCSEVRPNATVYCMTELIAAVCSHHGLLWQCQCWSGMAYGVTKWDWLQQGLLTQMVSRWFSLAAKSAREPVHSRLFSCEFSLGGAAAGHCRAENNADWCLQPAACASCLDDDFIVLGAEIVQILGRCHQSQCVCKYQSWRQTSHYPPITSLPIESIVVSQVMTGPPDVTTTALHSHTGWRSTTEWHKSGYKSATTCMP